LRAESQAEPEPKGAALGQWQHGSREATSVPFDLPHGPEWVEGLVGFSEAGCQVDSEPQLSSIL